MYFCLYIIGKYFVCLQKVSDSIWKLIKCALCTRKITECLWVQLFPFNHDLERDMPYSDLCAYNSLYIFLFKNIWNLIFGALRQKAPGCAFDHIVVHSFRLKKTLNTTKQPVRAPTEWSGHWIHSVCRTSVQSILFTGYLLIACIICIFKLNILRPSYQFCPVIFVV